MKTLINCFVFSLLAKLLLDNGVDANAMASTRYDKTPIQSAIFCSLYQINHCNICNMLSKSSKWELGFVHYITKFTISRFECIKITTHTLYLGGPLICLITTPFRKN